MDAFECPNCGSAAITEEWFEESPGWMTYELRCNECGAEWSAHYDGEWFVQGDDDYREEAA